MTTTPDSLVTGSNARVPLVVIDVGNSRIKVGVFREVNGKTGPLVEPVEIVRWTHNSEPSWPDCRSQRVIVGSVAPEKGKQAIATMPASWPSAEFATAESLPIKASSRIASPGKVGIDRLANAAAAARLADGEPAIVIDAGTATTIDLIDDRGRFAGGAILPGLQLSADALTNRTEMLPTINMLDSSPGSLPGTDTVSAIRCGLLTAVAGGIASVVDELNASVSDEVLPVFLCGGDAEKLAEQPALADAIGDLIVVPALTLIGLSLSRS